MDFFGTVMMLRCFYLYIIYNFYILYKQSNNYLIQNSLLQRDCNAEENNMFQKSMYNAEEERLAQYLKRLGQLLLVLGLALLVVPLLGPGKAPFVAAPILVSHTIAGLFLLALLAWFSKADVRRLRPLVHVFLLGLLIASLASLVLYFSPLGPSVLLLLGFVLFGLAALGGYLLLRAAKNNAPTWQPWIPDKPFLPWERTARWIFVGFGILAMILALGPIVVAFADPVYAKTYLVSPLLIAGSGLKEGVIGLLAFLAARDVRKFVHTVQAVTMNIVANITSLVLILVLALFGFDRFGVPTILIAGMSIPIGLFMASGVLLDAVVVVGLILINRQLDRIFADEIQFLNLYQFRALEGIAETLIAGGEAEILEPYQVVLRTDKYLRSFHSHRLRLAKLAVTGLQLWPLLYLMPPVSYLNPYARYQFIDKHFKQEVVGGAFGYRLLDAVVKAGTLIVLIIRGRDTHEVEGALTFTGLAEAMVRFNMQLSYLGYYSNPDVWTRRENGEGIGYVPFSKRPKQFEVKPVRHAAPLKVITPEVVEQQNLDTITDADVVIIGSGAAGSTMAEKLLAKGRSVLLLEKGLYVDPQDFTEDEVTQLSNLYADGALQIAQSLRFTVLQGSCVGGTTVVNNAVCFDTPQPVLDRWNSNGQVIDVERFRAAQAAVNQRMRVRQVAPGTRKPLDGGVLNHGDMVLGAGIEGYFANNPTVHKFDVVAANIADCLGCGYCNIGCPYGRKLSMLDLVLPVAQEKYGADQFRIMSEAEATRLTEDNGRITKIEVSVRGKRTLRILNPKTVIVSGGTVASSWLLMQSGIGKGKLPVGRGLCFNMGSPLHALFDRELNAFDGLQISHYLQLADHPGFIYETWYNPPVAQAMAMPGWLDTHFRIMQNYNRITGAGILVGTESSGVVVPALLSGGPDIVFHPSSDDLDKLVQAMTIMGEIYFEAGAREVYVSTRSYRAYHNRKAIAANRDDLSNLRQLVKSDQDILLGTGHPQGGNALASSPQHGVIGPDFKVFGYNNLYVADASVFPTATTVNPQLTVMSVAAYASEFVE